MRENPYKTYGRSYVVKINCSKDQMADVMYAVIITKSKILSIGHLGLEKYNRRQNAFNGADLSICIPHGKEGLFTELAKVLLVTIKDFQGELRLNNQTQ
jgi:hypothetical protein